MSLNVVVLPTEARTVENPLLDWLQSAELGWRYEDCKAVAREYRARRVDGSVDEREVLLLPILKEQLIALNPGVSQMTSGLSVSSRGCGPSATTGNGSPGCEVSKAWSLKSERPRRT
jgi:hypothetical protein